MSKYLILAATAVMALASNTAQAAIVCALSDITPTATACSGFFDGNVLNNNAGNISIQTSALAQLGYVFNGDFNSLEKISSLNGSHSVDFTTLLKGTTYVAFHFGNGQDGPGNATAFYKLNAGAGLDVITLLYNASSNAVLYSTSVGGVPEPASWALMFAGFGMVGISLRRRRPKTVTA
jgi:hypothetical protein